MPAQGALHALRVAAPLTPRRRDAYAALTAAWAGESTADFTALYHRRAGIEGTISQGVRAMARYIGLAKTHLQHVLTAAALNVVRLGAWLDGVPLARTRQSAWPTYGSGQQPPDEFASRIQSGGNITPRPQAPTAGVQPGVQRAAAARAPRALARGSGTTVSMLGQRSGRV